MEVTDFLLRRFSELQGDRRRLTVGICGRAGAGKTTLGRRIERECELHGIATRAYSGDWRFLQDSPERKQWLLEKWRVGIDAYLYAINQFSWWDFQGIQDDLELMAEGEGLSIQSAYNRDTGLKDLKVSLPPMREGIICYENCILGGVEVLEKLDIVLLVNTSDAICLARMLEKDSARRSASEVAIRFLMTTYSENRFLNMLTEKFSERTFSCDSTGLFGPRPSIEEVSHIPIPLNPSNVRQSKRGTVFLDLDGTLIEHVPIPSETGEEVRVLEGSVEKLRELREKGYFIVLTTSRPQNKIYSVLRVLKDSGMEFDQVISDLPVGPRHLVNDSKGDEVRAFSHVLERNRGISELDIS